MCSCVQNNLIRNYWFWWIYFSWITQPSSVCDSCTALQRPSDMYIYMYCMCLWYLDRLVQLSTAGLNGGLYKQWHCQTTTPGVIFPALCEKHVVSITEKMKGARPTIYYSYPRSLINWLFLCSWTVKLGQIWDIDTHICNSWIKTAKFEWNEETRNVATIPG